MKKSLAMILALVLAVGLLAGCGGNNAAPAPAAPAEAAPAEAAPAAPAEAAAEPAPAAEIVDDEKPESEAE